MTKPAVMRQADLARVLKACRDAGYPQARIEIEDGRMTVIAGRPTGAAGANTCDELFG